MNYDNVQDTFFEAFQGKYVRALITDPNEAIVKRATYDSTSITPGRKAVRDFWPSKQLRAAEDSRAYGIKRPSAERQAAEGICSGARRQDADEAVALGFGAGRCC